MRPVTDLLLLLIIPFGGSFISRVCKQVHLMMCVSRTFTRGIRCKRALVTHKRTHATLTWRKVGRAPDVPVTAFLGYSANGSDHIDRNNIFNNQIHVRVRKTKKIRIKNYFLLSFFVRRTACGREHFQWSPMQENYIIHHGVSKNASRNFAKITKFCY